VCTDARRIARRRSAGRRRSISASIRVRPWAFWILNSGFWILCSATLAADTRLRVEFTERGDCVVTTNGPSGRSHVRYPRHVDDWRCAVTTVRDAGIVDLDVVAPPATRRPASTFPQLTWREEAGRWVGRARLPAAPAFVRIVPEGGGERWLDVAVAAAAIAAGLWSLAAARGR
jgi:hypothetical protein